MIFINKSNNIRYSYILSSLNHCSIVYIIEQCVTFQDLTLRRYDTERRFFSCCVTPSHCSFFIIEKEAVTPPPLPLSQHLALCLPHHLPLRYEVTCLSLSFRLFFWPLQKVPRRPQGTCALPLIRGKEGMSGVDWGG